MCKMQINDLFVALNIQKKTVSDSKTTKISNYQKYQIIQNIKIY